MRKLHGGNRGWLLRSRSRIIPHGRRLSVDFFPPEREDELVVLRGRVQLLRQRVERIKHKIGDPKPITNKKASAIVDEEECIGCGLCYEVCPTGAISVNGIAQIDSGKCIACLACVGRCPQGAIAVKYGNG
jgi:ferredoxin